MSRIAQCFSQLKSQKRRALIPYVTAGDPHPQETVALMHACVAAGADVLELGVPFSDPMADGPVIQRASERALAHNVSLRQVLQMVQEFRSTDNNTPVVLMGYLNPVEVMGYAQFAQAAVQAGVDGVLTVDMPPEEASLFVSELKRQALDPIFLLAPTSDEHRIRSICNNASGYVYYVSLKGVTGAASLDISAVAQKIGQIRQFTALPIGVGFGIKDADTAARIAEFADAVVVGSALIEKIENHLASRETMLTQVSTLLSAMRRAMDGRRHGG